MRFDEDAIAVLTTTLGLGGCIPAIPGLLAEPRTFRVTPKYTFAEDLPSVSWSLAVAEPSALGESPFWHPHEQMLYWVDIAASQVCRANIFMGLVQR